MSGLVENAADTRQVNFGKKAVKRMRERDLNDLRAVLLTPQGRRVLWRLIESSRVIPDFTAPAGFTVGFHDNAAVMAYTEGARGQGQVLISKINEAAAPIR